MRARLRQVGARVGAVFLFFVFLFLFSLPNLIDLDNYRPMIVGMLQRHLAGELRIGHLRPYIGREIGVKIVGFSLTGGRQQRLSAEVVKIGFHFWPLLHRRLQLASIRLVRPRVKLCLAADRPFAAELFIRPPPAAGTAGGSAVPGRLPLNWQPVFRHVVLQVRDGTVDFVDQRYAAAPVRTFLTHLEINFHLVDLEHPAPFHLRAVDATAKEPGKVEIEGTFSGFSRPLSCKRLFLACQVHGENLDAGRYWPYYSQYVPMKYIGARVSLDASYEGDLLGHFTSRGRIVLRDAVLNYPQVFPGLLPLERLALDYRFSLGAGYETIRIDDVRLVTRDFTVTGSCRLDEIPRGRQGRITVKAQAEGIKLEKLFAYLPVKILPTAFAREWRRYAPRGTAYIREAYLTGTYEEIGSFDSRHFVPAMFGGTLELANASVWLPAYRQRLEKINGVVRLAGDDVEIVRLKAGLGSVLTQQVQGRLHSWLHQPVLTLEDRFDLTLAAADPEALRFVENTTALLRPRLPEVAAFLAGSEVLTGRAQVSLRLRWPLGGPVASWELGGRLQDVSLENTAFVRPLAMINGGFKLYADRLVFEEMSCKLGDSPVKLDGRIDNYRDWRHCLLDLSLEAPAIQPLDFTIIPWLTVAAGGAADVPHASSIKLAVSGSPGDWQHLRLHGRVDLRHLDLSISPYCRRLDDLTLAAVFAGQEVEVKELTCHCLTSDLRLRGRGRWQPENYRLAVNLESNQLVLDDLICPQRQELVLDLAALYRSLQDSWEEFSFQAGIKKLRLPTVFGSRYPRDFHDVSWDLAYRADELQLKKLCFSRQLSDVKLTGRLRLDEKGAVDGSLEHYSSYLDYNDFLPAAAGRPPAEAAAADEPQKPVLLTRLRRWCQGNSLVLVSRIDHLAGKGIEIGHLDGEIQVARNFLLLKSLTGHLWGGEGKIRGIWSLQDNSFSLTTDLTGINVKNVNDLLSLYPEKSLPLRGTGDVNLALKWQGDTYEQWRRHLNGWIKFAFAKGRLLRFTALANIFSLLNVSQLFSLNLPNLSTDGLPYDRFSGSFKVKDGVLSTEDILVRGPAMNISAAGDISLPRRWVDMEVSVQPLQTVGKTIAMIPIIGYIITGEGKTLIAMNFTVKGPFGKTKVESIPFRGLVSKSGEILKRLIGTPVRILSWPGKFFSSPGKEAEGARDDQAGRNVPDQGQEKEDKP